MLLCCFLYFRCINNQNIINLTAKYCRQHDQIIYGWKCSSILPFVDCLWCSESEDILVVLATVFGCRIDDILVVNAAEVQKTA